MAGNIVAILALAAMYCAGIGATVYLVNHGHPWFAAAILLFTSMLRITRETTTRE